VIAEALTLDELAGNPHPHLARLRARSPVAWVPALGGHLVTGRAAAVEVLRDPATFTVDDERFSTARVVGQSMLSTDGSEHTRHRQPYVASFRARRVEERFGGFVRAETERLVAGLRPGTDLRAALAGPLAAAVVAESLGLGGRDPATVARLLGWYRDIVASVAGMSAGGGPTAAGAQAMAELDSAMRPRLDAHAGALSPREVLSNAAVIMFGGIETTEGMILNALWFVLGDPELRAAVAARPNGADAAVEESLRLEPAASVVDRYATRDVTLAGATIGEGDLVVVSLAGANRDPAEFAEPDRFVLDRPNVRRHLAFAAGPHVCIGMDLARLEARVAVSSVVAHLPAARLAADAPAPTGLVFRKPESMVVDW
jgi:cytochrome P450